MATASSTEPSSYRFAARSRSSGEPDSDWVADGGLGVGVDAGESAPQAKARTASVAIGPSQPNKKLLATRERCRFKESGTIRLPRPVGESPALRGAVGRENAVQTS